MSKPERKLKIAVNPELIDKNEAGHASLFATGWINVELTPDELAEAIQSGIAYCPQLTGSRKAESFQACNVASVDVIRASRSRRRSPIPSCGTTPSCSTRPGATPQKPIASASSSS